MTGPSQPRRSDPKPLSQTIGVLPEDFDASSYELELLQVELRPVFTLRRNGKTRRALEGMPMHLDAENVEDDGLLGGEMWDKYVEQTLHNALLEIAAKEAGKPSTEPNRAARRASNRAPKQKPKE